MTRQLVMDAAQESVTAAQQKHWERGQAVCDGFEAIAEEAAHLLFPLHPGNQHHPAATRFFKQVGALRDFLADSHLPGENESSASTHKAKKGEQVSG